MSEWFAKNVRESLYGSDLERAQQVEAKTLAQARAALVSPGVRAELKRLAKTPDEAALIGTLLEAEDDLAFCVALDQLRAHMLVTGANGVGKTFIVILMLVEALTKKKAAAITVFDMKGELAELLTTRVLPAIAMSLTGSERDAFLDCRTTMPSPRGRQLHDPNLRVRM